MKNILTKLSLALSSLVLALTALAAVPVLAEDGGSSGSGGTGTSDSGSSTTETNDPTPKAESETELRHGGSLMVQTLEQKGTHHTAEERKTACEAHKQGLTTKFSHITTAMTGYQTRIDAILAKAEAYQQTSNVTVANWDSLVAAATTAQTTSASSIAALKAVTPTLDCNSTSVAQDVATFKTAAEQARSNLKAYKTAVRAVVKALLDAKNTSGEGSGQ